MDNIKYDNRTPLQHFHLEHIPDLLAMPQLDFEVAKIAAQVAETADRAIVNAIIEAAKEEGITDLYLIDKRFIVDAIRDKMEMENAGFVQVVRCKDCKHYAGECTFHYECDMESDDFCSYGERRETNHG